MVRDEWGGQCVFNSFSSQARGVAIFLKKNNPAKIIDSFSDTDGNLLAISLLYEEKKILLEVLYGPNQDTPNFYSEIVFKQIQAWNPDFSIFAGDYNVVLDHALDTKNYQHENNPFAREALKNQIHQYNLVDIWRELHPDGKQYTWRKFNENKQSRLDYFLISASLLPYVQNASIIPSYCSDHSGIELEIDFSKFIRGRGFWKFNTSLLNDPDYIKIIKNTIKRVTCQYAIVDNDENFYNNATNEALQEFYYSTTPETLQYINLNVNPQAFLDVLLMEIRRETILYSAKKKRDRIANELLLVQTIEDLETKIAVEQNDAIFKNLNAELQNKKLELDNIYAFQAQGAFIRARARYQMEGEKPSKLFCSLEKHNATQKHISKLIVENNGHKNEVVEQKLIEQEIFNYYKDLFAEKNVEDTEIETFLTPEIARTCPKLNENEKQRTEGLITVEELTRYLKTAKNNVSPGSSGFSNEFYKFFWIDLKVFITKAINYSYELGMLSVTQRLGIITLIPKGEKDKTFLKNWRPLTLLNSLYKIVSGCIAERIKPALNKIIHGDQKGFVSERYIGEAIRSTYDIIQWAKSNNKTGLLLLIDFEKAYDSLSFTYIKKCLIFFNFSQCIINWVEILLHNFMAVINHCGNISKKFNIGRGARQGDPIASYIFIICIEILAHKLRNEKEINGFNMDSLTHLLELYADDCTIFLEPKDENLRKTLSVLDFFFKISGLRISVSKTKAVWFGRGYRNNHKLCPDLQLDWGTEFKLLGIDFTNNLEGMESNFNSKIEEIKKVFNLWFHRTLTVYGKIVVIKTLALPKLCHLALVLPDLSNQQIKELENLAFNFLWNNKPDKIARDHTKLAEKAGGLGFPDIKDFWQSLKFSWLRRAINTSAFWPNILIKQVESLVGHNLTISELLQFGPSNLSTVGKKIENKFWKQVFCSVGLFMQGALFCYPEKLIMAPFWDNPYITRNNRAIKKSIFPALSHKLSSIIDFYRPGTCILYTREELMNVYNVIVTQETITELHYIIKNALRGLGLPENLSFENIHPFQPLLIYIVNLTKKGCNVYYRLLRKKNNLKTILSEREGKWHNELSCTFGVEFWNKTYNLAANIKFENRIKYLQYQINRNSLFTNYRVSKFQQHISPSCTFCLQAGNLVAPSELISHLFFDCDHALNLWQATINWLKTLNVNIPLDRKALLFGLNDQASTTVNNYLILYVKYFIWKSKFQTKQLTFTALKTFLKNKVEDLKMAYFYEDKECYFEPWLLIYTSLVN